MKVIAPFFLFLFIGFLSTPTIVKLIEKATDAIVVFSIIEEEHVNKELKSNNSTETPTYPFELETIIISSLIFSEDISSHENISKKIFSPPPNFA